jgi:flagellum-specific peptidoglycan hydrolase FlgJ
MADVSGFISDLGPIASKYSKIYNIPASVCVAQAAEESG